MQSTNYIGKGRHCNSVNGQKVRTPWDRQERKAGGDFGITWPDYLAWHLERDGYLTVNRWNGKRGEFELVTYHANGAKVTIER